MSVGLYDIDFMTYVYVPFNLNLMKLASYYKKKKEVVVLAPKLEPERYQKMYVVKDYADDNFDRNILESNVTYSGHAFTKEFYSPMPDEIEICRPDNYLYHKFDYLFCVNKSKTELFKRMTNAEHIRLSLDGKTIWADFDKAFSLNNNPKTFIFHDYNVGAIKDSYYAVKDIVAQMDKKNRSIHYIGTKFPIQIKTEQELRQWLSFKPMGTFYTLQYNNIFEDELLNEAIQINPYAMKKLWYNVTSVSFDENHFVEIVLPKIFRQALFLKSRKIPISLIYTDNFFKDKRWERIIDLFNYYLKTDGYKKVLRPGFRDFSRDFTLFRYITCNNFKNTNVLNWYTKEELRDLFQLVREKNYETFKMFYESCIMEFKGGKIVDAD